MAISFPSSIDTLTNPTAGSANNSPSHAGQHSDANDAIEALEAKVGADSSAVTTSHDYKLSHINGADGWTPANESWSYASASTITVPSGAASRYAKGDFIKWTQTTVKYGTIVAVADTLLTIAVNTDYTVANAAISANYYCHGGTPIGFPGKFNFAATINYIGGTTDPTSNTVNYAYYSTFGNTVLFSLKSTVVAGTGNRTFTLYLLPITRVSNDYIVFASNCGWNSTNQFGTAYSDQTTKVIFPVTINQNGSGIMTGQYWF